MSELTSGQGDLHKKFRNMHSKASAFFDHADHADHSEVVDLSRTNGQEVRDEEVEEVTEDEEEEDDRKLDRGSGHRRNGRRAYDDEAAAFDLTTRRKEPEAEAEVMRRSYTIASMHNYEKEQREMMMMMRHQVGPSGPFAGGWPRINPPRRSESMGSIAMALNDGVERRGRYNDDDDDEGGPLGGGSPLDYAYPMMIAKLRSTSVAAPQQNLFPPHFSLFQAGASYAESPVLARALVSGLPARARGEKKAIPDEQKDGRYFERRKRNNLAAKKSRDARKGREELVASKAVLLEKENSMLKTQVSTLREEASSLQQLLIQKRFAKEQQRYKDG